MISYKTVDSQNELVGILELQQMNLEANLSKDELQQEGFVTVHHDLELLSAMNKPHPHIIAKDGSNLIGYALVMLSSFGNAIPVLVPMFKQINDILHENKKLSNLKYFVMGQVCISKKYRGQGVFAGLYNRMRIEMENDFDYIITEIAARNKRSLRAHEKVGFVLLESYADANGEEWVIVLLQIRNTAR